MADIKALLEKIRALRVPVPKGGDADIVDRVRASFASDGSFNSVVRELGAPRAYSAAELAKIYNAVLERQERFPKNVSKKRILDQLAEEREIMIANDNARRVISAHSGKK